MINRFITDSLVETLKHRPVVFLNGARQVGKSTLVQWLAQNHHEAEYYTMDDINILSAAQSDPVGFLSGLKGPVIIDEIQRVPNLFLSIKAAVDSNRTPGQFLLTGSAHLMTLPKLSQALVGRMAILPLYPLSSGEINENNYNFVENVFSDDDLNFPATFCSINDVETLFQNGGYPEIITLKMVNQRNAWFNDYINTVIQRDVKDIANIAGMADLPRLLYLLAGQTGQLLNIANLSRKTGIEQKTLKRYIILLESVFLIYRLPAWFSNIGKRLIKTPKIFFNDTGLLTHLLGGKKTNMPMEILGSLLENYILLELIKMASWCPEDIKFYYYRTASGVEIDIIMENKAGEIVALEVKRSGTIKPDAVRGIKELQSIIGEKFHRGIIFYSGEKIVPMGKNIYAVPVGSIFDKKN